MLGKSSLVKVGISSCLLGENVRYNGEHKLDSDLVDYLSQFVELVPICPEVEIGLGVPRKPIELRQIEKKGVRAVRCDDFKLDVTNKLKQFGKKTAAELKSISGYVFKSRSPSCGINDARVRYSGSHESEDYQSGIYSEVIIQSHPLLPTATEVRLQSSATLGSFMERIFVYRAWQALPNPITVEDLVKFHNKFKFNAESRSFNLVETLENKILNYAKSDMSAQEYITTFMHNLSRDVLHNDELQDLRIICGFLYPFLSEIECERLSNQIQQYANEEVSLCEIKQSISSICEDIEVIDASAYLNLFFDSLEIKDRLKNNNLN